MLPPKRLQKLLSQAVQLQVEKCPFHYLDLDPSENSLLTDHICTRWVGWGIACGAGERNDLANPGCYALGSFHVSLNSHTVVCIRALAW